ncbi:MAG: hypothetical protein AB7N71_00735 [Phycisphaerae bacterium]
MDACNFNQERLLAFADDPSGDRAAAFEDVRTHLACCAACASLAANLAESRRLAESIWCERVATPVGENVLTTARIAADSATAHPSAAMPAPRVRGAFGLRKYALGAVATAAAVACWVVLRSEYVAPTPPSALQSSPQLALIDDPADDAADEFETLKWQIERCGLASQLLAAADHLARQPGGAPYAATRYEQIIQDFADTPASEQAAANLLNLSRS